MCVVCVIYKYICLSKIFKTPKINQKQIGMLQSSELKENQWRALERFNFSSRDSATFSYLCPNYRNFYLILLILGTSELNV